MYHLFYADPSNAANKDNIQVNSINKGKYEKDLQYKGTAYNAPRVTAELDYIIDGSVFEDPDDPTQTLTTVPLPVTIKNQFFDDWVTPDFWGKTNMFTTHVNSYTMNNWKSASENDMMAFYYQDTDQNGNVRNWIFDCFHSDETPGELLTKAPDGTPDESVAQNKAGNFGNYGVTYTYTINIYNSDTQTRYFNYCVNSQGNHIYDDEVAYYNAGNPLTKPPKIESTIELGDGKFILGELISLDLISSFMLCASDEPVFD